MKMNELNYKQQHVYISQILSNIRKFKNTYKYIYIKLKNKTKLTVAYIGGYTFKKQHKKQQGNNYPKIRIVVIPRGEGRRCNHGGAQGIGGKFSSS